MTTTGGFMKPKKQLIIYLTEEKKRAFKALCEDQDTNMNAKIKEFINKEIKRASK